MKSHLLALYNALLSQTQVISSLLKTSVDNVTIPSNSRVWPHTLPDSLLGKKTGEGFAQGNSDGLPMPSDLAQCVYGTEKGNARNLDWQGAMSDAEAELDVAGVWWSAKDRDVPITLVTQVGVPCSD